MADKGEPTNPSTPAVYRIPRSGPATTMPKPISGYANPVGVVTDNAGKVYVMDAGVQQVYETDASGTGQVTVLAGSSAAGSDDGPGDQARFDFDGNFGGSGPVALIPGGTDLEGTLLITVPDAVLQVK